MDWDHRYSVSRSLTLEISPDGNLVVAGSLSRDPRTVKPDALPLLLAFASGATPREAFTRLQEDWEVEEAGFADLVKALFAQDFLVPHGATADLTRNQDLPAEAFGSVRSHFSMLKDPVRVLSYRSAIDRHARGKTVVEIGCGTGILSLFAAKAGARRVIAIEESGIHKIAEEMFAANGCSGVIDLRVGNSRNVEIDEPADLIIHEILGVDPFEEKILPVLADARQRLLRPGGRLLPHRLEIGCFGVESEERPGEDYERKSGEAREFAGLYGLDFSPFLSALANAPRRPENQKTWIGGKPRFEPQILSEELRLLDIDFANDDLVLSPRPFETPLRIVRKGILRGAVLFFRAHLDEEIQLTTSPLAPPTSWGWNVHHFSKPVPVSPGDEAILNVAFEYKAGIQSMRLDLG